MNPHERAAKEKEVNEKWKQFGVDGGMDKIESVEITDELVSITVADPDPACHNTTSTEVMIDKNALTKIAHKMGLLRRPPKPTSLTAEEIAEIEKEDGE